MIVPRFVFLKVNCSFFDLLFKMIFMISFQIIVIGDLNKVHSVISASDLNFRFTHSTVKLTIKT